MLLAVVSLLSTALLLAGMSWRHRAVLALLCATGALALAGAAPLASQPSSLLIGSLAATAIGAILLVLGLAIQRLLNLEPRLGP